MNTRWKRYESAIALIISILSLIISLVFSFLSYRETRRQSRFQESLVYDISAEVETDFPIDIIPAGPDSTKSSEFYRNVSLDSRISDAKLWVKVKVTNNGMRTFSVERLESSLRYTDNASYSWGDEYDGKIFRSFNSPADLPLVVEPGHQEIFYIRITWPTPDEVTKLLDEYIATYPGRKGKASYGEFSSVLSSQIYRFITRNHNQVLWKVRTTVVSHLRE